MRYRISNPDEYLAITGMGVRSVRITKAAWVWPFQRCTRFSVQPHDYAMDLQAMTKEKLQFSLPVVFTVGPDVNRRGANALGAGGEGGANDFPNHGSNTTKSSVVVRKATPLDDIEDGGDALVKYVMLLANDGDHHSRAVAPTGISDDTAQRGHDTAQRPPDTTQRAAHVANIIKGIIEGETRVLVSSLTMEEIFSEREVFKRRIFRNIQSELDQFGLKIYNANVKELKDAPGSVYFGSLSRKAHEGATNQARSI